MPWDLTGNLGTTSANFLGTTDRQPLVLKTNKLEALRIDINRNVGIGTGHPNKTLSVNGTIETAYEGIYFGGMFGVGGNDYNYGIGARESDSLVYDTFQYHRWRVGTNEKMTLDGSGNLGIGVNNPGMALDVHGRIRLRDGTAGPPDASAGLWINTANGFGSDGFADIGFIGAVDPTRIGLYGNDPRGGSQWGFTFDTVTGNVGIGIGTTYPDATLQVGGSAHVGGGLNVDGGGSFGSTTNFNDVSIFGHIQPPFGFGDTRFNGSVTIENRLMVSILISPLKLFRIDHPLDPANKYLNHACVESPDLKTIHDGTITLDSSGEAVVELPNWFDTLNKDFRYQLTCIGGFAPVYIADEITGNRFKISGGNPGMRVCWQVTGVRDDPFARANPIAVEEDKPDDERGYYQNPEVHGQPQEMGIQWMRDEERRRRRPPHAGESTTTNSNTD